MNKKGVEISMNVLIVAAIGLLVLVVLSVIFLGRIGTFGQKSGDCAVQGGKCVLTSVGCGNVDEGTGDYQKQNPLLDCPNLGDEPQVCCLPIKV